VRVKPRLISCYFTEGERWPKLARVLEHTAQQHCQGWDIQVSRLQMPTKPSIADCFAANNLVLTHWCQAVHDAPVGTPMLLVDADMAILRPLDDVWDQDFDIAYTVRETRARYPLNAGVVFVRAGWRARAFFRHWLQVDDGFLADPQSHLIWKRRWGGINQAALGCVLDHQPADHPDVRLLRLPCAEWNCEDYSWSAFEPQVTRILHVKSDLRRAVFSGPKQASRGPYATLAKLWLDLEQQACAGETVTT